MDFSSIREIQQSGFQGFISVAELQKSNCEEVPSKIGVYLFIRLTLEKPNFLEESVGGWFKDRNPTVSIEELEQNWVPNTAVVYIGKAGTLTGKATLKSRLRQYMKFGQGKKIGHWGGRYIWQLEDHAALQVCWQPTPEKDPGAIESELINQFRAQFGKRPFANLSK